MTRDGGEDRGQEEVVGIHPQVLVDGGDSCSQTDDFVRDFDVHLRRPLFHNDAQLLVCYVLVWRLFQFQEARGKPYIASRGWGQLEVLAVRHMDYEGRIVHLGSVPPCVEVGLNLGPVLWEGEGTDAICGPLAVEAAHLPIWRSRAVSEPLGLSTISRLASVEGASFRGVIKGRFLHGGRLLE